MRRGPFGDGAVLVRKDRSAAVAPVIVERHLLFLRQVVNVFPERIVVLLEALDNVTRRSPAVAGEEHFRPIRAVFDLKGANVSWIVALESDVRHGRADIVSRASTYPG